MSLALRSNMIHSASGPPAIFTGCRAKRRDFSRLVLDRHPDQIGMRKRVIHGESMVDPWLSIQKCYLIDLKLENLSIYMMRLSTVLDSL